MDETTSFFPQDVSGQYESFEQMLAGHDWTQFDPLQAEWATCDVAANDDMPASIGHNHKTNEKLEQRSPSVAFLASNAQRLFYPGKQCATCGSPLDTSEQLMGLVNPSLHCSQNPSADHLSLECRDIRCLRKFANLENLQQHSGWHKTFCCAFPGCESLLGYGDESWHFRISHPKSFRCAQCGFEFDNQSQLDDHGTYMMHAAYVCSYPECGSQSARLADLIRHQLSHKSAVPRYPCPHCRKYRGQNGFKRKDHLRQHIRNFHHIDAEDPSEDSPSLHICHWIGCDRVGSNAFATKKLLAIHLKKDHPSPFQCPERGCDRVGTKGWMRERDMFKHIAKVHSAQTDVLDIMGQ